MFTFDNETERKLYVEALFQCLDRGAISPYDACRDMRSLLLSVTSLRFSLPEERVLVRRIMGVLNDYCDGVIDKDEARANFEGLLLAAATDDVGFFTSARLMADA
ncbi:MAG: hypothetical protein ACXU8O_07225 [Asticcacaulis sp.]